jgi:hypothetical protein
MEQFNKNLERFEWNRYQHYIHHDLYRELVKIVAEVMELPAATLINIEGTPMQVSMVKEVYLNLTSEHLQSVCEEFNRISYYVKSKKTYLRAMLYNEVFEYEATITNDVNVNEGFADV